MRVGKGPRIRLRTTYGSEAFSSEYQAALAGGASGGRAHAVSPQSLQWLWDNYRQTGHWLSLSQATRYQREKIMERVLKESGTAPFANITKGHIVAGLDRRGKTPAAARNFLKTLRGLFKWAVEREHIKVIRAPW